MQRLRLRDGDLVHVSNRYGAIVLPVQAEKGLQPTQLYLPMHWGGMYLSGRSSKGQRLAGVNALTTPEFCPRSKQPELKHVAVRLLKAEMPWTCMGMAWLDESQVLATRAALTELMAEFDFASCVLFGRSVPLEKASQGRAGVQFRAAAYEARCRGIATTARATAVGWCRGAALCRCPLPMQPCHGHRSARRRASANAFLAVVTLRWPVAGPRAAR